VTLPTALRRGWTTGACATAAAKAAYTALLTGSFPDPIQITLPAGKQVSFALAEQTLGDDHATAGIVKDAGDDPDVTHGALILATVHRAQPNTGVTFRAGPGVGTVTKPGLPLAIGEPAINPMPREMMRTAIAEVAAQLSATTDVIIEISIPNGEAIALKTMNPRLGILGGLSILGTTGIVIPYSCAAWIASIHEGIDVARALGLPHIAGATGSTSEAAVAHLYQLSESALIDMGDFVGGMLKYIRTHPVPRVTIAGGFAKISKLAQGRLDLHSDRSQLNLAELSQLAATLGASPELQQQILHSNTGLETLQLATQQGVPLAQAVALQARAVAERVLEGTPITLDVVIVDREGTPIASAPGPA
jgi:cobalt-precorrin-5B (C1)-methyltransferase